MNRHARGARVWTSSLAVTSVGAVWAALCATLSAAGHAPSFVLLPVDRERYYAVQAVLVVPALLALWLICAAVSSRVARALGGEGTLRSTAGPMGLALALPLLVLFLVPDFVVYALYGFDALGALVRVTGPLSFAVSLALATLAVRSAHALAPSRAFAAAAAGVVLQAAVGGAFLR